MTKIDSLRQIDMLADLSDSTLAKLASLSRRVDFAARQTLFRQHDEAKDVFFVISGKVSVAICAPKIGCRKIGEVTGGGFVGWSPLLKRSRMSAAAQAIDAVQAIAIHGEDLLAMCNQSPELGFKIMQSVSGVLADRLTATRMQLFEAGSGQLPEVQIESD